MVVCKIEKGCGRRKGGKEDSAGCPEHKCIFRQITVIQKDTSEVGDLEMNLLMTIQTYAFLGGLLALSPEYVFPSWQRSALEDLRDSYALLDDDV